MSNSRELLDIAEDIIRQCAKHGIKIAVAESCTGGLISGCLTAIPGASEVFERGFVTYTNEAKSEMLGVDSELIAAHGAVSWQVAVAMAEGALVKSSAHLSAAVSGIAGPGGGTSQKPVGLVHIATAMRDNDAQHQRHIFNGNRETVRKQALKATLLMLRTMIG